MVLVWVKAIFPVFDRSLRQLCTISDDKIKDM